MKVQCVVLLTVAVVSGGEAICSLCGHPGSDDDLGVQGLIHPLEFVDSKGKTCAQLMVELFNLEDDDSSCVAWYNTSHERCCHSSLMSPITQDPPPPPPQFTVDGPYAKCDLCIGGGYPSARSMVITMLYLGSGSCPQYYEWGQRGWIQDRLCPVLQHFAFDPCGCSSSHIINRRQLKKIVRRKECGMNKGDNE